MRARIMLTGVVAGLAMSFVPQASAVEPVNCHHMPWLCDLIEGAEPSINCHHIQWVCNLLSS